jgi:hypothetical protein
MPRRWKQQEHRRWKEARHHHLTQKGRRRWKLE